MTNSRQVTKCGNSLAVCIPNELLEFIGAKRGTTVFIEAKSSIVYDKMLIIYKSNKEC